MNDERKTPGDDAADFLLVYGGVLAGGDDQTRDALTACEKLLRSYDALTASNAALWAALEKYGRHGSDEAGDICARSVHSKNACTCGFDAALKGASNG